jgi:hypothetical protein
MNNNYSNWFQKPTEKQVIWATFLWAISVFLLLVVVTNGLSALPFQAKHMGVGFVILTSTFAIIKLHRNYHRSN